MPLSDLNERANTVLKKYEKYDGVSTQQAMDRKNQAAFTEECEELDAEISRLVAIAAEVAHDRNKATVACKNAEIRRVKNVLLTEAIDSIQKLVKTGKGVNKEIVADRQYRVQELVEKIHAIPDGMSLPANKRPNRYNKLDNNSKKLVVMLDVENTVDKHLQDNPMYWQEDEEAQKFQKHWKEAEEKQDAVLGRIGNGVARLGEIARNMGSTIDRQEPLIDGVEAKVQRARGTLKTNNTKVQGLTHKLV